MPWSIYTPKGAEQPVCETCNNATATISDATVRSGEERSINLCTECAAKAVRPASKKAFSEKCYYCESPAVAGFDCTPSQTSIRGVGFLWVCKRCAEISADISKQVMDEFKAQSSPQNDPEKDLPALVQEIDRRIREKRKDDPV